MKQSRSARSGAVYEKGPPLRIVPDSFAERVSRLTNAVRRRFPAHAPVTLPETVPMVLLVEAGAVARQLRQEGDPVIVEVLGAGHWLCSTDSTGDCEGAEWSLATLAPTTVIQLPLATFRMTCANESWLAVQVMDSQRQRQSALLSRFAMLHERSSTRQVASTLLYLSDAVGEKCPLGGGVRIVLPQHVIAATVGLARQTTNRELRRLHQSRIAHIERGMVCVVDRGMLMEVAAGRLRVTPAPRPAACKLRYPAMTLDCEPIEPIELARAQRSGR